MTNQIHHLQTRRARLDPNWSDVLYRVKEDPNGEEVVIVRATDFAIIVQALRDNTPIGGTPYADFDNGLRALMKNEGTVSLFNPTRLDRWKAIRVACEGGARG